MQISLTDVYRIAHLARIEIDAADAEEMRAKLASIFGLIEELVAVDTTGVEPMAHAQEVTLPLRDDLATEPDLRERYQAVAPAVEDGLYLVPKVLE
jgi:aspartyl-tRNA(Asn)/glutamyl-tRNA(Gln) amidotransferase subunit C